MALDRFDCGECNGGGYRDNGDGELVACYVDAMDADERMRTEWMRRETLRCPPLTEQMIIDAIESGRVQR